MSASYVAGADGTVVLNRVAQSSIVLNAPAGVVLTGAAAGALNSVAGEVALGDANARNAGAAGGTFVLQKNTAGAINITAYLPISVGGVDYWIPLAAVDPQVS
jgi:hypothetical protein